MQLKKEDKWCKGRNSIIKGRQDIKAVITGGGVGESRMPDVRHLRNSGEIEDGLLKRGLQMTSETPL